MNVCMHIKERMERKELFLLLLPNIQLLKVKSSNRKAAPPKLPQDNEKKKNTFHGIVSIVNNLDKDGIPSNSSLEHN